MHIDPRNQTALQDSMEVVLQVNVQGNDPVEDVVRLGEIMAMVMEYYMERTDVSPDEFAIPLDVAINMFREKYGLVRAAKILESALKS